MAANTKVSQWAPVYLSLILTGILKKGISNVTNLSTVVVFFQLQINQNQFTYDHGQGRCHGKGKL